MPFQLEDPREQRTQLRKHLYQSGFTPVPTKNKVALYPNWSKMDVTPDEIDVWATKPHLLDTGIRCGEVIAIDWDISDADLLNSMLDALIEDGVIDESLFVRIGKAPRELWVYRTVDKVGKMTTGFFQVPTAGEDDKPHQVEILGTGCQFAAYGMRDSETWYTWPELALHEHEYNDLPVITLEQITALRDAAIEFFKFYGLHQISNGSTADAGYAQAYDLTDDMRFEVKGLGDVTVAEIREHLQSSSDDVLRCKVDTLRPGTSGSWAGMISLVNDNVCLSDHGSYTSHFHVSQKPVDTVSVLTKLMDKYPDQVKKLETKQERPAERPLPTNTDLDLDPTQPFENNHAKAIERFAYAQTTDTVIDAVTNVFDMKVGHFRNFVSNYFTMEEGRNGRSTVTSLYDVWMRDSRRKLVTRAEMRPDKPVPFYEDDGNTYYNIYREHHLPTGGDPSFGFDIVEKLLPIAEERHYFLQWLSYKLQYPDTRGPGIIMVAHDNFGTGRGSLGEMIKAMFSVGMVRTVDFDTLTGKGTQGQYNEWLVDALLVMVNEAQEAGGSKWQARHNAYEHLKNIVDPGHHDIYVKRKGLGNYMGRTSASVLVFTNHKDSVVLPEGDRRFAVLENGPKQSDEYWKEFHAWRKDPSNIGAFMEGLRQYPLEGYDPYSAPPMTHAKADMLDAGGSPLDRAFEKIMPKFTGPLLVREQVIIELEYYLEDTAVEFPDDWQKVADRVFSMHTRKFLAGPDSVRIDGKQRIVRQLRKPELDEMDEATVVEEVMKNGPVIRPVTESTKVVKFGSKR